MSLSETNKSTPSSEFEENLQLLRQIYFFSGLPLETLKIFAYLCTRAKFKEGEHIFRQNEDDGHAVYIVTGKARLEREDNGEAMKIRDCESGEFLGGADFTGRNRPVIFP